jgi:putative NIF3 family GTP cyclohydrolase 1 type 2
MGVIAEPDKALEPNELLHRVSNVCLSPVKYNSGNKKLIEKIAIVGGSGCSFLQNAIDSGCDAFITADITYHKFHQVNSTLMLIDPGHYEMEQFVSVNLSNLLRSIDVGKEIETIHTSETYTNPVRYFPQSEDYKKKQMNYLININKTV